MSETLYRRPLPDNAIAFSSAEGRKIFGEALAAGGLDGYFPLAEQFHTQSDPAFCGLGSLVVALNALGIDPGRLWKGPWRWFAEDLLDCCVPLSEVRERGLDLDELACLARCNGADVMLQRADLVELAQFRQALADAARGNTVLLAAYDRAALGQTGAGHFSPLGGYHAGRDRVLVLDVARFKYPAHWLEVERLWKAMRQVDPSTGLARGWLSLSARAHGLALGFSISCEGESWRGLGQRLARALTDLAPNGGIEDVARAILPLSAHLVLREPVAPAHQSALSAARALLKQLSAYQLVVAAVGAAQAEATLMLLLAIADRLTTAQRAQLGTPEGNELLVAELSALGAQLGALWGHAQTRDPHCTAPQKRC